MGLKIVDIEQNARVIYLEDEQGRGFTIDLTGKQAVVHKALTDKERLEVISDLLYRLIEKFNIDIDALLSDEL